MARPIYVSLNPDEVAALLSELCVELGFCLPPAEITRLQNESPTSIDAFTDAVILAEGLNPQGGIPLHLQRQIRVKVLEHFQKAEIKNSLNS